MSNPEEERLRQDLERTANWKRWGPYLAERQWGTVREDYSPDGACWDYLPHDHARSRTYRWGEDGLLGISDRQCRLCFAVALWNGKDPILKERLFGLNGPEGNHGEDVKECYYYLEATPTHSYLKGLYKYPQREFPYNLLVSENRARGNAADEFELVHTGIFDDGKYFDVFIEYAKNSPNDLLIRITVHNRSSEAAAIDILPTIWFRNTWSWGRLGEAYTAKPQMSLQNADSIICSHSTLGEYHFECEKNANFKAIFTDNETNIETLYGQQNKHPFVKDAFHHYVVNKVDSAVSFRGPATKAAFHCTTVLEGKASRTFRLRLFDVLERPDLLFEEQFDAIFKRRIEECDQFYKSRNPPQITDAEEQVIRQAYAGLIWSKQFYYYSVREWQEGDPTMPSPAEGRKQGRNKEWAHLYNRDVISMPDKWEYPWYAAWDLAFHMISFARIDPQFAKQQLLLFLREWYMHPNGQIPAYEFAFSDVNPPVHAWACWRIYKISAPRGKRDLAFLEKAFHKLLLNFTWWVNRKDIAGNNLFSGGFLGLDNIGVFDRSRPVPGGGTLEQADATAWMAFYSSIMLAIALELASHNQVYEDIASKFFEHFIAIVDAMNTMGGTGLWDEEDGFYYDQIQLGHDVIPLKIRSLVGIMPLITVEVLENSLIQTLPGFKKRMAWFLAHRLDLEQNISFAESDRNDGSYQGLLAVASRDKLQRILERVLDENEFLSPFGVRSLSKIHAEKPFVLNIGSEQFSVAYDPGESHTTLFGGNSNWRGPVWFPINYLLIESLERFHHFYGERFKVECPTGSGNMMNLKQVAEEIGRRLTLLFLPGQGGQRPCHGDDIRYQNDRDWRELVLFYEYFHGDTGKGLGASHQTGWTALVTRCLEKTIWARAGRTG
ncbi:MAG: glucosidase [Deltaproteobacteria bacterium]|nr:glucosidase [Deltaproteobacteria bacterium]